MPQPQRTNLLIRALRRPEGFLIGTFGALITTGAILLALPIAHAHDGVGPLDALFTATSAVCVTGLIVVDTATDFSRFGQCVILVLIQLGGLGIMTFAALVMQVAGQRISFRSQVMLQDVFHQESAATRLRQDLKWIILLTLAIEGLGAAVMYAGLPDDLPARGFAAVFHAISAFCNAGFSTFSDSLMSLSGRPLFMVTLGGLIVVGGLGFTVLLETVRRGWGRVAHRPGPVVWSLNTRVVITTTAALILVGTIAFTVLGLSTGPTGAPARAGHALFQSITARTAGFNTVNIGHVTIPSLLGLIFLMFVGGSPGSCAGGVKTTSLAIWLARLRARLRHREDVTLLGRRIPVDLVRRTGLLLGVAAVYNLVGVMILSITEVGGPDPAIGLEDVVFEQVSAFATVGLSTGLTPELSVIGRLWVILTMFVGRLGPLTMALVVVDRKPTMIRLPEERLMIG